VRRLREIAARRSRIGRPLAPEAMAELQHRGPAPLLGAPTAGPLSIAVVVPSFRRGSGGHATIVSLLMELVRLGHTVTLWLEDIEGRHASEPPALTRRSFASFFGAKALELHTDFDGWRGADVVIATGWQTVARTLVLPGCGARAYLVQDHEPEFYPTSAESLWAASTYRLGLHCIAASPWLAGLLRERYGASSSHFDLAVDHEIYRATDADRERGLVVFYARAVTPRRAVPLGLRALKELADRRPELQIGLFGEPSIATPLPFTDLGVLDGESLAALYSRATVGMALSLTNPSLIALEMMACGLPCVELASESILAGFGRDGPLALADADPLALCDALERLLDDPPRRRRAGASGIELMAGRTWARAARQLEQGIRQATLPTR
jgi:glycosyltransferase involved in cell wall biosynthesis